jgi:altered-inheritance-of-mitochondria protein 13
VHDELNRLSQSASTRLAELSEQISATPDVTPGSQQAPAADGSAAAGVAALTAGVDGDRLRDLGRESVLREIQTLKHKLKFRKLTEGVVGDASEVGNVKEKLVKCLRENDRRPLDCWQEVQQFKSEVARLERGFLGKVMQ